MSQVMEKLAAVALCASVFLPPHGHAAGDPRAAVGKIVAEVIEPLRERYGVPGMAVGIVAGGRNYVFDYGVASKATGKPVTDDTLFELGSISKTFTATLASLAQLGHRLSLSDPASKDLPSLRGSSFDHVSLLELGTHTSGGLPLQVPDGVTNDEQLISYLKGWKPTYPPGTYRLYSNPSIGLLGMIAAKSLNEEFDGLEGRLFSQLGMAHAHLHVPQVAMADYAQGYTKADVPTRMTPGVLASEAYGVKATAADMLRFVEANMRMIDLPGDLQQAIEATHTAYFRIGPMTQDLIWEQYPYPVARKDLLAGNAPEMAYQANPAARLDPPLPPRDDVLINKTGSTNGFGAYVAFVPARKLGIVLLANENFAIEARVEAAYRILKQLESPTEN